MVNASGTAIEPQFSDVFVAGKDGFPAIPIPSVVVTKKGAVLAIVEGRAFPQAVQADIKIILKRGTDNGKTGPVKKLFWPGSFASSVLAQLPDGNGGCPFEAHNTDRTVFARFSLDWGENHLDDQSRNWQRPTSGAPA